MGRQSQNLLKSSLSRLSLATNSYTSNFSEPWAQYPNKFTTFLCCTRANNLASFMNSFFPFRELCDNFFTAISFPLSNLPYSTRKGRHFFLLLRNTSRKDWIFPWSQNVFLKIQNWPFSYLVNGPKASFPELVTVMEILGSSNKSLILELLLFLGCNLLQVLFFLPFYIHPRKIQPIQEEPRTE